MQKGATVAGFKVNKVDILEDVNGPAHHTDDYESDALVVRRGASFQLDIGHDGAYVDGFYIELRHGKSPRKANGTLVEIFNGAPDEKDEWSFQVVSKEGTEKSGTVRVSVAVPFNALVSCYQLAVCMYIEDENALKEEKVEFALDKPVYILFNPWCQDDDVYMESEDLKSEYVLNDAGYQYVSGHRHKSWNFGQFTDVALKCTFKLLESAKPRERDTVIEVCRYLSSKANSCDNNGLLAGNWSGDYSGGMKPWQWVGSVKIFKKYLETETPVNYGQCWVFSGVLTSLMRCLGIPARSVTNYDSAHDGDNNCTFDKFYDEDGSYLDESDDSCWNFHVWNDVWMARPDLAAGLGGWQAIDATPQERSRGIFQCGPASLQAIKEGNINMTYDTKFVFAEVNADTVYWQKKGKYKKEVVMIKGDSVGSAVLTKKPNLWMKENITNQYKHPEGSLLERATVKNALKKAKNPAVSDIPKDVTFTLSSPTDVEPGTGIEVTLKTKNETSNEFNVNCTVVAHIVRYTGVKMKTLMKRVDAKKLAGKGESQFTFKYEPSELLEFLDENISIRFSVMAKVQENKQMFVEQKICNIHKPELKVEIVDNPSGNVKCGDTLQVKVTIPSIHGLSKFTGCSLEVECPIIEDADVPLPDTMADGTAFIVKSFKVKKIKKQRETKLGVTFNSKEISGVQGELQLHANPAPIVPLPAENISL